MKYKGYTIEQENSNSWTFSKEGEKTGADCSLCEAKARIDKRISGIESDIEKVEVLLVEADALMNQVGIRPESRAANFKNAVTQIMLDVSSFDESDVLKVLENQGWTIPQLFKHEISLQIAKK